MIELKNLTIKYGDFVAVKNINVEIQDGEFFTFLGPSGCGKTTTLRSISGFEKPSEGQIFVNGEDVSKLLPEERNIGFVFQNYALFPSMTVFENIAYGLKIRKANKEEIIEKVNYIAEKVGISQHLDKKISELSGGQQQRIAVARALVVKPKILLMDEPLSNLDAKLRISMREEIKRLQSEFKITTIYVTHDQEEALAISDNIAVFNNGVIEQIGVPKDIYNTPKTPFVAEFIGDINKLSEELSKKAKAKLKRGEVFYVRPESVKISSTKIIETDNSLVCDGEVKSFEFLGVYSKARVSISSSYDILCLNLNDKNIMKVGEKVYFSISLDDIIVYDEEKSL